MLLTGAHGQERSSTGMPAGDGSPENRLAQMRGEKGGAKRGI
jgi:hypothetical protein